MSKNLTFLVNSTDFVLARCLRQQQICNRVLHKWV